MRQAFTLLYSKVVLGLGLAVAVIALVLSRLRRRLRVSADQRVSAPLLWLVNVTADARLHRRLRRLAQRARAVARGRKWHRTQRRSTAAQRLALDLEAEVVDLAERLVQSRALDYDAQQHVVHEVRADADRIDTLVDRAATLVEREATERTTTIPTDPIGALATRLDELESLADARRAGVVEAAATATPPPAIEASALDSPT